MIILSIKNSSLMSQYFTNYQQYRSPSSSVRTHASDRLEKPGSLVATMTLILISYPAQGHESFSRPAKCSSLECKKNQIEPWTAWTNRSISEFKIVWSNKWLSSSQRALDMVNYKYRPSMNESPTSRYLHNRSFHLRTAEALASVISGTWSKAFWRDKNNFRRQDIFMKKVSESWLLLPVSERILALPIPEIATHCFEVLRRLEA